LRVRPLTDLVAHRRKVLAELQAVSAINPENAVRAIQEELTLIEAGLEELADAPSLACGMIRWEACLYSRRYRA
jgi:hypothetical protein